MLKTDGGFEITLQAKASMFVAVFNANEMERALYCNAARRAHEQAPETFFSKGNFKSSSYRQSLPHKVSHDENNVIIYFNRLGIYVVFVKDPSKVEVKITKPVLVYEDEEPSIAKEIMIEPNDKNGKGAKRRLFVVSVVFISVLLTIRYFYN